MRALRIAVAIAMLAAFLIALRMLPIVQWLQEFQLWVRGAGAIGYVAYIAVYILCCVLLIPALPMTLGAGAIFGFAAGALVNLAGATLGATAAFLLGRTVLRSRVERLVSDNVRFRALDRAFTREGTRVMWLSRISGFPPFTWVNYAFGLTGIGLRPYFITTLFGIIPGTIAFTWAGAAGAAALTGRGNRVVLIATAVGAIVVSASVARIAMRAIRDAAAADS